MTNTLYLGKRLEVGGEEENVRPGGNAGVLVIKHADEVHGVIGRKKGVVTARRGERGRDGARRRMGEKSEGERRVREGGGEGEGRRKGEEWR